MSGTVTYSTTTVSATLAASNKCSGLSTGATIGIAVGAALGGLLLAGLIIVIIIWMRKRSDTQMNREIRGKEMTRLAERKNDQNQFYTPT